MTAPSFSVVERVLHPTDFSEASLVAFHHALKASMVAKSNLTLLHVSPNGTAQWSDFPGVRETLELWGELPPGSERSAVRKLGIDVGKILAEKNDPVEAVLHYLKEHPADLIVLSASRREGLVRWLGKSVSEPVTREAQEMTLIIPSGIPGFVSAQDGSVNLSSILIPITQTPPPQPAVSSAVRLVQRWNCPTGTFHLVHVGESATMPAIRCPEVAGWEWQKELRSGPVIEGILNAAKNVSADLIVMSTDGRNGFLDGLRGSHSERVLRYTEAPLLTVPVGSRISRYLT